MFLMASRTKHIKFGCPYCGQQGEVVWNSDNSGHELVRLSNGFHFEEGRMKGMRPVIICNICDEIDPPHVGGPTYTRSPNA